MKYFHQNTCAQLTILPLLLLLLSSCSSPVPAVTLTPPLPATPTSDLQGLSPDAFATLSSVQQLDDYPFYIMHYAGGYEYPELGFSLTGETEFTCSLFASLGEAGDKFYGRNFDWSMSPALLLFTDPPDGYASVSMVDLEFLGIHPQDSKNLADLPLTERTALLSAPSMPFDGMNEYGLTIGMAALPGDYQDHARFDPSKPTLGSIGIIRLALDHARDVDEAVALFEKYNIDFRGGPLIHYLLADPGGNSMLIEFYQGEMIMLPNEAPWHLATNHFRCTAVGDGGCMRYHTLLEQLNAANGQLDAKSAMHLLSQVKQGITQWSAVYNMTDGTVDVALEGNYKRIYSFDLDDK
jgi:Acyl-coenzyme A:6-aminopenicillanic acid acyl-transferase